MSEEHHQDYQVMMEHYVKPFLRKVHDDEEFKKDLVDVIMDFESLAEDCIEELAYLDKDDNGTWAKKAKPLRSHKCIVDFLGDKYDRAST